MGVITDREQALAIARIGHAVLDKLHTSPVPTFALINGLALGGGLEIALHAHYRTVSAAAAGIALPECFLGLVPGWGGAYLVPNLIGTERRGQADHREPAEPEPDARRHRPRTRSGSPTRCSTAPTSWSARWTGPAGWSPATITVDRRPVDRGERLGRRPGRGAGVRRRQGRRRRARRRTGRWS